MSNYLLLGPVLFGSFEMPDRIGWGGGQSVVVHQLPGGARVIDALGRDDAEIAWSGVFSGNDASLRARLVDTLRAGGGVWPLSFDAFFYSVIITRFEAQYSRSNWIPYRIACTVLRDEAGAVLDTGLAATQGVLSDLSAAATLGSNLDVAAATAALAVSGAQTRAGASYGGATKALAAASSAADQRVDSILLPPVTSAATLNAAADGAGQLAQAVVARGFVRRAATNLANAST